ncbi:glycoside hydrolase family 53 protein [Parathielavia hyrcaniae]|uniref:Arabinogalactan endo-beta-1,4-galactanase n=1 Tax=Parathielavia hyrcaniae TaxID=113614 RepID=A0AAN6Q409_9PEZI|nr:glycoside hydrolase family 53 protein [Parathielavia hyrcaniae]
MMPTQIIAILAGLSVANGLTYRGVDWSSVLIEERAGVSYKNTNGIAQPLERILVENGVNTVRQRVWVNPWDGNYNIDYNIALARRAKAVGLGVFIDFHYSDTWADPAHQTIPSGWPTDIDNLSWKLYNYTLDASNRFQDAGVHPKIMSIGNEITPGLLWPTGRTNNWSNIARLLRSAAWGIKDSRLNPKPKIMIHLDNGWNWDTQNYWYTNVLRQGTFELSDFDMMGVSFYPFYSASASLDALRTSLNNMARGWNKEIAVVETNWPTSCPSPRYTFPSDVKHIPFSAAGQATYVTSVANVVSSVSRGVGLFYWEPAWIHNANLGSSCADNTMFSQNGQALSSLSVFQRF